MKVEWKYLENGSHMAIAMDHLISLTGSTFDGQLPRRPQAPDELWRELALEVITGVTAIFPSHLFYFSTNLKIRKHLDSHPKALYTYHTHRHTNTIISKDYKGQGNNIKMSYKLA